MIIREANIKIESVIQTVTADGISEGEAEKATLQAVGYYHFKDSAHALITYAEKTESGDLTSELLILPSSVRVKKQGAIVSDMRIETGVTDRSVYSIPPYRFDMTVMGVGLSYSIDCSGGEVTLEYKMSIGGADRLASMKIWISTL